MTNKSRIIAYYIAFGPHGPRALPPPGENMKIFTYTIIGLLVSFGLFAFARAMARPPPRTMTQEYQEKTNEYLRVRLPHLITSIASNFHPPHSIGQKSKLLTLSTYRAKTSSQSLASPPRVTSVRAKCKASLQSHSREHTQPLLFPRICSQPVRSICSSCNTQKANCTLL